MSRFRSAYSLLALIITIIFVIAAYHVSAFAQTDTAWYWRRGDDSVTVKRTRAELDSLIKQHRLWLMGNFPGHPIDLRFAQLSGADLLGTDFSYADLSGAKLQGADLSGAHLSDARLEGANLINACLEGANLVDAHLSDAHLSGANLMKAGLSSADLSDVDLSDAYLAGAHLEGAYLEGADLSGTLLWYANLSRALLSGANLDSAVFEYIDSLPYIDGIAQSIGLHNLIYRNSPASLIKLREAFAQLGYRSQEREIICALRRHNQSRLEYIFIDLTSEWGSNLARPWWIFIWIWVGCSVIYYLFMIREYKSGLYLIAKQRDDIDIYDRVGSNVEEYDEGRLAAPVFLKSDYIMKYKYLKPGLSGYFTEIPRFIRNMALHKPGYSGLFAKIPMVIRLAWWAFFFSSISSFNIGFRDVNFGRWLRLLTRTEFDLQPFGWVRVVSGFQALISVYLIALWILSFSGTPFK